jgi:hypothetical protein
MNFGVGRMRKSSGVLKATKGRARAARQSSPFSLIGATAVAGVMLACAGTLYANVFSAGAFPSVGGFDDRFSASTSTKPAARQPMALAMLTPPTAPAPLVSSDAPTGSLGGDFAARFAPTSQSGAPAVGLSREEFAARFAPRTNWVDPAPEPVQTARAVAPQPASRQVAALVPLPNVRPSDAPAVQAARVADKGPSLREIAQANKQAAIAAANAPTKAASIFEKLFGKSEPFSAVLAFASPDGGVMSDGSSVVPSTGGRYDRMTAVYDISAKAVYLPDGTKLEAHSGLGPRLDDPRFVHEKMRGATPPHVYDLSMRESLFHGVEAIRLNPVGGEGAIHGRTGLLAHTYMLGPNGDSNGCVSFRDYEAFLRAFKRQQIKRLAVVAKLD